MEEDKAGNGGHYNHLDMGGYLRGDFLGLKWTPTLLLGSWTGQWNSPISYIGIFYLVPHFHNHRVTSPRLL